MRVLVVHNRYVSSSPSGENNVVESDVEALLKAGVEVDLYTRSSDEIADLSALRKVELIGRPMFSAGDVHAVGERLRSFRPDVVHLHNVYPLISPWVIRTAKREGVPVVQTVHNYRHECAAGTFFRDGAICTDCAGRRIRWPAVIHSCYRNSRGQSAIISATQTLHAGSWRLVDRFLPVSRFMAEHLVRMGIRPGRIVVRANSVPDPGVPQKAGDSLLFAGRLVEEKGLPLLIEAWIRADRRDGGLRCLVIAGDGPFRGLAERTAADREDVEFVGAVSAQAVGQLIEAAGAVAVPSTWYEGLPMVILESFSRGRAVVCSRIGSLAAAVDDEVGWTPDANAGDFADVLGGIDLDEASARGTRARERYLREYTPEAATAQLLKVYEDVCAGWAGPGRNV